MTYILPAQAKALKENSHRRIIAKDIDEKAWLAGIQARRWPVGASWVCILQTVYEKDPRIVERPVRKEAMMALEKLRARNKPLDVGEMTPERMERMKQIAALPDSTKLDETHKAFREAVGKAAPSVTSQEEDAA